jgi:DinB superfamily
MNRTRIPVLCLTTLPWLVYTLSCNAQEKKPEAAAQEQKAATLSSRPTAAEISKKETIASALLRQIEYQVYEVRSAAEAMPEEKYAYRPSVSDFAGVHPSYGSPVLRTFAEQVKHVACANFAFAAELDGQKPPDACDKGGPSPAKTRTELLVYLRDSFSAVKKSVAAVTTKSMFDPIEGPYAGPNTRLGLAEVVIWHAADHYGQMVLYLRLNGIVPPASRPNPPELHEKY